MARESKMPNPAIEIWGCRIELFFMPAVIVQLSEALWKLWVSVPLASLHKPFPALVMQTADPSLL